MSGGGRNWLRRDVLAGGGTLIAGAAFAAPHGDPLSGENLYRDVRTYVRLGVHRTGSSGDNATAQWLVRALSAAGYRTERQGFDYPVFSLAVSDLSVGSVRFAGMPLWTPRTTPAGGLLAPLSVGPRPGAIAVISLPYSPGASLELPSYRKPIAEAVAGGALGVVAITENPVGELVMLNADPKAAPWDVPVLLVAGRDRAALLAEAAAGTSARLRIEGATAVKPAYNVIARRAGAGPPIVVSTPKSGWLQCAGERGSGLAIWLGLARWAAAATPHNLLFLATSGHEFHGYGGHYAAQEAPKPGDARIWIHIGANVAAYDFALRDGRLVRQPGPQPGRGLAATADIVEACRQAFGGQPGYATPTNIDVQRAPGEVALYHRLGHRPIVGLVGGHPLHHTPRDLEDVTSPEILEPVARGLQTVIRSL